MIGLTSFVISSVSFESAFLKSSITGERSPPIFFDKISKIKSPIPASALTLFLTIQCDEIVITEKSYDGYVVLS